MKQTELRPGNWVYSYQGKVEQISGLSLQCEPAGTWPTVRFGYIYNYPHDLKPIKITEEWLEKLGFTIKEPWPSSFGVNFYRLDKKVNIGMSNHHGITIRLTGASSNSPEYMIEYVHELQNIYHFLTGETI